MNILIVGLGSIARKHIAAIRALAPEARIYGLRSSKDAPPVEGVTDVYALDEAKVAFDFAIISNPTSCHAATIEALMGLRIPLFIEKPVFGELDNERLVETVESSGILNYVACNLRFLDSIRYLHDYIASHPDRRVNEVNVYCGSHLPDWRPGTDYRKCYSAIPELGGGVNIDLIHDIDYVYWIFGRPEKTVSVCRNVSSLGIRAIDYANYTLLYPKFTASVILNYYRRDYRRTVEIVFDDDTWLADLKENVITDSRGTTVYKGTNTPQDTYLGQMEYFLNLIKNGGMAENTVTEAYNVLKICLGNERSKG